MRTMYDSTTPEAIPASATAVAGYPHGDFRTWKYLTRHFRKANKLSIGIRADETDCAALDCEAGDVNPTDFDLIETWVRARLAMSESPVIYASRDNLPNIIAHLTGRGIKRPRYRVWSAHYVNTPHLCSPAGCGADFTANGTQWTDKALGRNLDESLIAEDFFPSAPRRKRLPPKPHPKVTAAGIGGALMTALVTFLNAHGIHLTHLTTTETSALTTAAAIIAGYLTPARK
jgi:hypothetical protein